MFYIDYFNIGPMMTSEQQHLSSNNNKWHQKPGLQLSIDTMTSCLVPGPLLQKTVLHANHHVQSTET